MSYSLVKAAWDLDIPYTEKFILICLCDHADDNGMCWPSVARIVEKTGVCERAVQRCLKWLREGGFFTVDDKMHRSRTYLIDPRIWCTPAANAPRSKCTSTPAFNAPLPRSKCTQIDKEPINEYTNVIFTRETDAIADPEPVAKRAKKQAQPRTQKTELPDDWQPSPFNSGTSSHRIASRWSHSQQALELESFTAHHRKLGNKFSSWQAAWSTWVLNTERFANGNTGNRSSAGSGQRTRQPNSDGFTNACNQALDNLRAQGSGATGFGEDSPFDSGRGFTPRLALVTAAG